MKKFILSLILVLLFSGCGTKTESETKTYGSKLLRVYASPGSMVTTATSIEVTLSVEGNPVILKYSVDGSNPETNGINFSNSEKITIIPSANTVLKLYISDENSAVTNFYYYKSGSSPSLISDFNGIRMYQINVSSFIDGDSSRNYGTGYGPGPHNGDLRGVINALDYIKSLNVNAIWLTPIFNSESTEIKLRATGYYPDDYYNIDPKFGTNEEFRELVNKAHEKGLYVFLDGVFGHHGLSDINGVTNLKEIGTIGYETKFPASLDFYKDVATYWIENYEIDGWRLDQAYQLYQNNTNYWKEIREAIEEKCLERKNSGNQWGTLGYMVGEIWRGHDEILTAGYGSDSEKGLTSCFDFPTRYSLVQVLATQERIDESWAKNQPASKLNTALKDLNSYPDFAKPNLMLTNHDLVRFGDLIERADFGYGSEHQDYWLRHKAVFSFIAAYTGPVTLYYGDEIGAEVEGFTFEKDKGYYDDHVSRSKGKISDFSANEQDLKNYVSTLMNLRESHPALWRGTRVNLTASNFIFADLKTDSESEEKIVYILNSSTSDIVQSLSLSEIGGYKLTNLITGDTISSSGSSYTITAKRLSGAFYLVE